MHAGVFLFKPNPLGWQDLVVKGGEHFVDSSFAFEWVAGTTPPALSKEGC